MRAWLDRHPRAAKWVSFAKRRRRWLTSGLVLLAHLAGALTSVRAIMEVRTSQGAVAWAISLNTFPYVAVPAYWVLGSSDFNGYITARRTDLIELQPFWKEFGAKLVNQRVVAKPDRDQPFLVEKLAMLPVTTGNDAELLVDGDATFASIFAGIERATTYLLVQFYIIRDDDVGRELKDRLVKKANEGVRCYLLYDEIGSKLPAAYIDDLRSASVEVFPFNTTQGEANRFQINFRNHRKIVIVDGVEAWVGGLNVGDEYKSLDPQFGYWRDTHMRVMGPVVQCIQVAFLEDWHWASKGAIPGLNWDPKPASSGASKAILCLPTGPADALETCTLFFLHAINSAKKRLWIASPYFVPDEQFISALQLAALRGVDVRILIPDKSDNMLVQLSAWSYMEDLEEVGIQVYRYTKGFMHHKVVLIDDEYCTIGTANFDNRSFRLNFEITMAIADRGFAENVAEMLEVDFSNSRLVEKGELDKKSYWYRLGVRVSRLTAPVQ